MDQLHVRTTVDVRGVVWKEIVLRVRQLLILVREVDELRGRRSTVDTLSNGKEGL